MEFQEGLFNEEIIQRKCSPFVIEHEEESQLILTPTLTFECNKYNS